MAELMPEMVLQVQPHNSLLEELALLLTVAAEGCTALSQLLRPAVELASLSIRMEQEMDCTVRACPPTGVAVAVAVQAQPVQMQ
jgi:hypothetical protein